MQGEVLLRRDNMKTEQCERSLRDQPDLKLSVEHLGSRCCSSSTSGTHMGHNLFRTPRTGGQNFCSLKCEIWSNLLIGQTKRILKQFKFFEISEVTFKTMKFCCLDSLFHNIDSENFRFLAT